MMFFLFYKKPPKTFNKSPKHTESDLLGPRINTNHFFSTIRCKTLQQTSKESSSPSKVSSCGPNKSTQTFKYLSRAKTGPPSWIKVSYEFQFGTIRVGTVCTAIVKPEGCWFQTGAEPAPLRRQSCSSERKAHPVRTPHPDPARRVPAHRRAVAAPDSASLCRETLRRRVPGFRRACGRGVPGRGAPSAARSSPVCRRRTLEED